MVDTDPLVFGYDIETTGTNPFASELVTIQYRRDGSDSLYRRWNHDSERDLLLAFLNDWKHIKRHRKTGGALFVAYNVLKFDAPYLLAKALQHDLDGEPGWNSKYVWENIVHGPAFLDLQQLLGDDMRKFAEWRNCLTGAYADVESCQIPALYERSEYNQIESYVRDELATLEEVYRTLRTEPFYEELQILREEAGEDWRNRASPTQPLE
jgi:hypothetical protein